MYSVIDVWYHKDISVWVDVLVAPISSAFTLVHRVNPMHQLSAGGVEPSVCCSMSLIVRVDQT